MARTIVPATAINTADLVNGSVTYEKIQDVAANSALARVGGSAGDVSAVALAASRLLGRGASGDVAACSLGPGLAFSAAALGFDSAPALVTNLGTNWNKYALGAGLFRNIRTITNDQVKALPTATLDIVSAPGANTIVHPSMVAVITKFAAGAYTNVGALTRLLFSWGGETGASKTFGVIYDSNVSIFSAFDQYFPLSLGIISDGAGTVFPPGDELTNFSNKKFSFQVEGESVAGDLTDGHASNTLTIICDYTLISV